MSMKRPAIALTSSLGILLLSATTTNAAPAARPDPAPLGGVGFRGRATAGVPELAQDLAERSVRAAEAPPPHGVLEPAHGVAAHAGAAALEQAAEEVGRVEHGRWPRCWCAAGPLRRMRW